MREAELAPFRTGQRFTGGRQEFEVLRLRAIEKENYDPSLGARVDERLGYVIFASAGGFALDGAGLPVVVKGSAGAFAIVTGTILVTLKDKNALSAVEKTHGLSLRHFDEAIGLASFAAPEASPLNALVDGLKSDPSVADATLEILQNWKRR